MRNAQNADTDFFLKLVSVFVSDKPWPKAMACRRRKRKRNRQFCAFFCFRTLLTVRKCSFFRKRNFFSFVNKSQDETSTLVL